MENLNNFIAEVFSLNIKTSKSGIASLGHYCFTGTYEKDLAVLQAGAATELIKEGKRKILAQLGWIEQKRAVFLKIWAAYNDLIVEFQSNGYITFSDVEMTLTPLIRVAKEQAGEINDEFFCDLADALSIKDGMMLGLIEQVRAAVGLPPGPESDPMDMLYPNLVPWFLETEKEMKARVEKWVAGKDKIGCAAFCLLLSDRNVFQKGGPSSAKIFARLRYKTDITNQTKGPEKQGIANDRKKMFVKYFRGV